jgi:hypothetical protein
MTEDDKPVSALPEKFEVFERTMKAADAMGMSPEKMAQVTETIADAFAPAEERPKRRRSTPAVKPKDMPEPEKKKRLTAADVPGVGGMIEKRWAGKPMWECPKCLATTFKEQDAKVHQCKQVKYADEEGLAD